MNLANSFLEYFLSDNAIVPREDLDIPLDHITFQLGDRYLFLERFNPQTTTMRDQLFCKKAVWFLHYALEVDVSNRRKFLEKSILSQSKHAVAERFIYMINSFSYVDKAGLAGMLFANYTRTVYDHHTFEKFMYDVAAIVAIPVEGLKELPQYSLMLRRAPFSSLLVYYSQIVGRRRTIPGMKESDDTYFELSTFLMSACKSFFNVKLDADGKTYTLVPQPDFGYGRDDFK